MSSPTDESPFHEGELAVQARVGVREKMAGVGRRVVRDFMPDQHRELFEKLPYLLLGTVDDDGRPWASILFGPPGFVQTPDTRTMVISARPASEDPAARNIAPSWKVGLLGIELPTRRRNRINGVVTASSAAGFSVRVEQSFGNCPQYITSRTPSFEVPSQRRAISEGALLSADAKRVIAQADTFFIATTSPNGRTSETSREGVDVSHRGGAPGFVTLRDEEGITTIDWPDYRGNFMFNTIGNLALEPRAALLFFDFAKGTTLSLTGTTEIVWSGEERSLSFRVASGLRVDGAFSVT